MLRSLIVGALSLACATAAGAQEHMRACVDISGPKAAIAERGGSWTEVTPEQRLFLAGVYSVNPQTPPGLPFGDKAAIVKIAGNAGALIFFIDGNLACTPMPIPSILVDMLKTIADGEISHEGQSN